MQHWKLQKSHNSYMWPTKWQIYWNKCISVTSLQFTICSFCKENWRHTCTHVVTIVSATIPVWLTAKRLCWILPFSANLGSHRLYSIWPNLDSESELIWIWIHCKRLDSWAWSSVTSLLLDWVVCLCRWCQCHWGHSSAKHFRFC